MEIELDTSKKAASIASELFEKAKELERKKKKAEQVLEGLKKDLKNIDSEELEEKEALKIRKEREWYEKFRWFFSSTGKLIIGGRDATSNEILLKKHANDGELVFHAKITGAPFFIIKGEPDDASIRETAHAAGIFSRAWRKGYGSVEVYHAPREQYTKQAPSGEYVGKGAFMVYGEREWDTAIIRAAVGKKEGKVTCGPPGAIEVWAEKIVFIEPGQKKPGEVTSWIAHNLDVDPNEVQRALPAGNSRIIKKKGKV